VQISANCFACVLYSIGFIEGKAGWIVSVMHGHLRPAAYKTRLPHLPCEGLDEARPNNLRTNP
jgi:hypothetical protein